MADLTAMMQAAAGNAGGDANFIEDVFSCFLYTGNGGTQTINNGIDLAGEGGLVWFKERSPNAYPHILVDTARGAANGLSSNTTGAQFTNVNSLTSFNANGFTVNSGNSVNQDFDKYVSWTFRKQPKFFDVVTYTGNAQSNRQIAHNLGSVPGCIIVKRTNLSGSNWKVAHRSLAANEDLSLNLTNAADSANDFWDNTRPTSTHFTVSSLTAVNGNSDSFVAYLFAHDAGGFGLSGEDNVISCGSSSTNSSGNDIVDLEFEPQWVLIKPSGGAGGDWQIRDIMRGFSQSQTGASLFPNLSSAEVINSTFLLEDSSGGSNGFRLTGSFTSRAYIYIAIRRGPMKVPTTGTSVFAPVAQTGNTLVTTNFPVDLVIDGIRNSASGSSTTDRLRGSSTNFFNVLQTYNTSAETSGGGAGFGFDNNNGYQISGLYGGSTQTVMWNFRRAPGFFDEVCYTGTGVARTVAHNLAAVPELMIVKSRTQVIGWGVYSAPTGNTGVLTLNTNDASFESASRWNSTTPTASVFYLGDSGANNLSGATYVAYLFASCPGVSKVGSYTGTGTTQVINCGFTAGSRFIMIKRTDSTGNWYVWDSARGIVAGNDPYLLLNSTAAEVTNTDFVDTASVGFEISSTAPAEINALYGTYIFLAVA